MEDAVVRISLLNAVRPRGRPVLPKTPVVNVRKIIVSGNITLSIPLSQEEIIILYY
jgi:hypothetical protein